MCVCVCVCGAGTNMIFKISKVCMITRLCIEWSNWCWRQCHALRCCIYLLHYHFRDHKTNNSQCSVSVSARARAWKAFSNKLNILTQKMSEICYSLLTKDGLAVNEKPLLELLRALSRSFSSSANTPFLKHYKQNIIMHNELYKIACAQQLMFHLSSN